MESELHELDDDGIESKKPRRSARKAVGSSKDGATVRQTRKRKLIGQFSALDQLLDKLVTSCVML